MRPEARNSEVTRLLSELRLGDPSASERIFEAVYAELKQMAERSHRRLNGARTLQPTALVHEAWLRLHDRLEGVKDRRHFLAVAALAMRQVLSNYARAARAAKREKGFEVTLRAAPGEADSGTFELVALDDSLSRLAELNPRHARVVELRFLLALSIAETAEVLDVSHTTVENDWAMARAWLRVELEAS